MIQGNYMHKSFTVYLVKCMQLRAKHHCVKRPTKRFTWESFSANSSDLMRKYCDLEFSYSQQSDAQKCFQTPSALCSHAQQNRNEMLVAPSVFRSGTLILSFGQLKCLNEETAGSFLERPAHYGPNSLENYFCSLIGHCIDF